MLRCHQGTYRHYMSGSFLRRPILSFIVHFVNDIIYAMDKKTSTYRIRRRFDDDSSLELWRGDDEPSDSLVGEIAARQKSQMRAMGVLQFETDWLYIERAKKKKRGWKVIYTTALLFDSEKTEVIQ